MYLPRRLACLVMAGCFAMTASATTATATVTVYTSRAVWQPLMQSPTTDTFEADSPANYPTPFQDVHGTRFTTVSGGSGTIQVIDGGLVNGSREVHFREFSTGMSLALDAPARGFGFAYTTSESWDVVVNGVVVASLAANTTNGFVGVTTDSGTIASFVLRTASAVQGGISVDSLSASSVFTSQQQVANYIRNNVLGGSFGSFTIWMTDVPVGTSFVARNISTSIPDVVSPYASTWWAMVDSLPAANWGHPCLWVAVSATLTAHTVYSGRNFPPGILGGGGSGPMREFSCVGVTPNACEVVSTPPAAGANGIDQSCLHAVLISGGWNTWNNHQRYLDNLKSMYQHLRSLGYPKSNIFVYYADGTAQDLDGIAGSEITGSANEAAIRAKISSLCTTLNPASDVLFIYTSNHGYSTTDPLVLWDFNNNATLDANESYTVAELAADTKNCKVCRLYIMMDQCYSGAFTALASDGFHKNTSVYTAASATEVSWSREYMACWETYNLAGLTISQLHDKVKTTCVPMTSHPQTAEGTVGNGDYSLNYCWGKDHGHAPWDVSICPGQSCTTVAMQIWNLGPNTRTYTISFAGLPVGPGCTYPGPTSYTMVSPASNTFTVSGYSVRTIKVQICKPAGMPNNNVACYLATVHNVEDNYTFGFRGSIWTPAIFWPFARFDILTAVSLQAPTPLQFVVRNVTGATSVFNYGVIAMPSDLDASTSALSLNGLAPGQMVTGSVSIPAGDSTIVSVTGQFTASQPNRPYDVQLLYDVDGNSTLDPVATISAVSESATTAVPMLDPRVAALAALLLVGVGAYFARRGSTTVRDDRGAGGA